MIYVSYTYSTFTYLHIHLCLHLESVRGYQASSIQSSWSNIDDLGYQSYSVDKLVTVRSISVMTETSICLIVADGDGDNASADAAGAYPEDSIATANRGPPRGTKRERLDFSPLLLLLVILYRWQLLFNRK